MNTLTITPDLLDELHAKTVLLRYNSPAPRDGSYGWLSAGQEVKLHNSVVLEQNVGLYGGAYVPMVGGRRSSGFASVGAFSYSYSALPDGLRVGRYCSISAGLKFIDSSHPLDLLTTSAVTFRPHNHLFRDFVTPAVKEHAAAYSTTGREYPRIGHDVWVGANVTIAMGVTVGTGAVLASNATVTRDVPPYAIVGGNPAQVIRYRFDDETMERLLGSRWWDYDPRQALGSVGSDFTALMDDIDAGRVDPYQFDTVALS